MVDNAPLGHIMDSGVFMSYSKKITFYLFACFLLCGPAWAQNAPQVLEKITVKRSNSGFYQQSFNAGQIEEKNLNAPDHILDYVSGLDLRARGDFGILDDISLRGSTYEQVAVMINGIKVMDPQTGHFNLDIPLTVYDLEQVAVNKNAASSFYGAGAFAGAVNFAVKKPAKEQFNVDTFYGENVLFGQAFSYSMPVINDFSARVSYDHKISKAARPNTDFEYRTGSLYLNKDFASASISQLFGWQKKDFGADSFYSNLYPEEEEHTQTIYTDTTVSSWLGRGKFKNDLYLRKHRDKFILQRNNPASVNYHTTYVYGLKSSFDIPLELGDLSCGIDAGMDQINSTNLGTHSRMHESGLLGFNSRLGDKINTGLQARFDHYQKWSWQQSFNLNLDYKIIGNKLVLKNAYGRGFRLPSFTELYYHDPANIGNPGLREEKSDTLSCGLDFKENLFDLAVEGFWRRGRNLIDWTRVSTADPWRAANLGSVDFYGVTFDAHLWPRLECGGLKLEEAGISYNYTGADKKTSGYFSKYALDILMHQLTLEIKSGIFGLGVNWQLSYNNRYYADSYFVGDLYISKKIARKDLSFEPFLKLDNFTNKKYYEAAGVLQPGRWLQGGVKLEW